MFLDFFVRKKRYQVAQDFFDKVMERGFVDCIISPQSSVDDFMLDITYEEICEKTKEIYQVDISDIKDGNLYAIFRRIEKKGKFK